MLITELEKLLEDNEEPAHKKMKLIDNVYKCKELTLRHKEVFLFKWIIEHGNQDYKEYWGYLSTWLRSSQFRNLNRNDINHEDFISIIELIEKQLLEMNEIDHSTMQTIINSILLLIDCDIFQHYFKYHVELYCKLISSLLCKIENVNYFEEVLKMDLFNRHIMSHEKFHKHFLSVVFPVLVECLDKLKCVEVFKQISKLVQKCLFYKHHSGYKTFIDQFFQDAPIEEQKIPKIVFKHVTKMYNTKHNVKSFKIILHAFCNAYNTDFELTYKFFILLVHIIGFNLRDILILYGADNLVLPPKCSLLKSQKILLALLDVFIDNKNELSVQVNNITFVEFLRNILKQILYFRMPSDTCYEIFLKATTIDPLLVEPITENIIIYTMVLDDHKCEKYEAVIIQMFDIYSKLRRVENFISKIVHTLSYYFNGHKTDFEETYKFNGLIDTEDEKEKGVITSEDIVTESILNHFSKCVCSLASWQVINVFKTLLYHLRQILTDIDKNDLMVNFMEIMCTLLSTLLCSIRVAEHTVAANVVEKSLKELEDLRDILGQFGMVLLNREHSQKLVRSFLNIAYNWGEIYITLKYYSVPDIEVNKLADNSNTACNITYLHSYLTVTQWCVISVRITNFGEVLCKQLLEKFYIQKLRAMLLFEESINEDVIVNVLKSISENIEVLWNDILQDKYFLNNLLPKMSPSSIILLAEKLVTNVDKCKTICCKSYISNCSLLVTAMQYVFIDKINKLLTKKKNSTNDELLKKSFCVKIFSIFTREDFLNDDLKGTIENIKTLYHSNNDDEIEWNINEEKLHSVFQVAEKFPVISCSNTVQKLYLLYFCILHRDFSFEFRRGQYKTLQADCERFILGILQHSKFKLGYWLKPAHFCKDILENYLTWEQIFSIFTENIFKDENSLESYEPVITRFTEKLLLPINMHCCVIVINIAHKMKKIKMAKTIKDTIDKYKSTIFDKFLDIVEQSTPEAILIDGYSWALKHFLLSNEKEKLAKLLDTLRPYIDFALKNAQHLTVGHLMLFVTILENKLKVQSNLDDDFLRRVWDVSKEQNYSDSEKYSQLIKLIFCLASSEEFNVFIADLLTITDETIIRKNLELLPRKLKIWESVLTGNLNAPKTKSLQTALEKLLHNFSTLQNPSSSDQYENIFNLEKTIVQTTHLPLTPSICDSIILSITLLCDKLKKNKMYFNWSISLLESLLKCRKHLVMDRLPPFLHLYRLLLKDLCERSNSNLNMEGETVKEVSDCSHQLEKLTRNLVSCQKDLSRIAMYLIADILQQYERITLHPSTKIHLNNCIYSLLTVCDQHAIAFLMRSLSSASTEIFKDIYENYKRFYRFTGKV